MTTPDELSRADWTAFEGLISGLGPDRPQPTVDMPGCNDDVLVSTAKGDAPTIVSRFWTDFSIDELATNYVDPQQWPVCGTPFWQEMSPVNGLTTNPNGFEGLFQEVVTLPTGQVRAQLYVTYYRDADSVWMTYQEAGDNQDVVVDRGCVMATGVTWDPQNLHTVLVYATKSIVFTNPFLNQFSDLACDNGWLPLMVAMVGKSVTPATPRPTEATGGPPSDLVDAWARSASGLLDETTRLARQATAVFTERRGALSLLRNTLHACDSATATTSDGLKAIRAAISDLAEGVSDR